MGRPTKWRQVIQMPEVRQFNPSTSPSIPEKNAVDSCNTLLLEEYEALRLKDYEGLDQNECAIQMQVSRPTFQRILTVARTKVVDSLVNGKSIQIAGGTYSDHVCSVLCLDCNYRWTECLERLLEDRATYQCPHCQSNRIVCQPMPGRESGRRRRGRQMDEKPGCRQGCWHRRWNQQLQDEKPTQPSSRQQEGNP